MTIPRSSLYFQQEESIYNLIPRQEDVPQRPPRHISKHSHKVHPSELPFGQSKLQGHATFGTPNGTNAQPTTQYLRAHEKEPVLPEPTAPTMPKTKLRAPVPLRNEAPIMGLTSNKNFITTNAVEVILAKPGKTPQDDFLWTSKPNYGKVPMYLRRNKEIVAQEKDQFEAYIKMRQAPRQDQQVTQLDGAERQQLLRHLKTKWASINTAYQKLSFVCDSDMKKHRKEELERMLGEIERDVKVLERGEMILVVEG